ncbi:MAG: nucleotidyltransferase family protein [Candidatus Aenigmarchaeota archaeon]|nr:nucleotidyltransferase family protein [Candidatus Aenigmarchaeota archaeon]
MTEAIILAGGFGKRMRPLTDDIPKCLIPVNNKPLLDYQLDHLRKHGIRKIVVACGYKWEKIKQRYGSSLLYSVEEEPLGTGGAVKRALEHVEGHDFLVLNADDVSNADISGFVNAGSNATAVARFHSGFGIAEIKGGKIVKFIEKPLLPYWANMGMHLLNKDVKFADKCSLEYDILPVLAKKGMLKAYKHSGFWRTANTVKEIEELEAFLKENTL